MLKKIILVLGALGVSSAALAHDGWDHGRDRERERFREHRIERVHEVPPPVAYPQPGVSVNIHLPL